MMKELLALDIFAEEEVLGSRAWKLLLLIGRRNRKITDLAGYSESEFRHTISLSSALEYAQQESKKWARGKDFDIAKVFLARVLDDHPRYRFVRDWLTPEITNVEAKEFPVGEVIETGWTYTFKTKEPGLACRRYYVVFDWTKSGNLFYPFAERHLEEFKPDSESIWIKEESKRGGLGLDSEKRKRIKTPGDTISPTGDWMNM